MHDHILLGVAVAAILAVAAVGIWAVVSLWRRERAVEVSPHYRNGLTGAEIREVREIVREEVMAMLEGDLEFKGRLGQEIIDVAKNINNSQPMEGKSK